MLEIRPRASGAGAFGVRGDRGDLRRHGHRVRHGWRFSAPVTGPTAFRGRCGSCSSSPYGGWLLGAVVAGLGGIALADGVRAVRGPGGAIQRIGLALSGARLCGPRLDGGRTAPARGPARAGRRARAPGRFVAARAVLGSLRARGRSARPSSSAGSGRSRAGVRGKLLLRGDVLPRPLLRTLIAVSRFGLVMRGVTLGRSRLLPDPRCRGGEPPGRAHVRGNPRRAGPHRPRPGLSRQSSRPGSPRTASTSGPWPSFAAASSPGSARQSLNVALSRARATGAASSRPFPPTADRGSTSRRRCSRCRGPSPARS